MKIIGKFEIKGRGTAVSVEDVPDGVALGDQLWQDDQLWTIIGIERVRDTIRSLLLPPGRSNYPENGEIRISSPAK